MDIVNHSAVLITSYHILDAVVRRLFTPPDEVSFTNTNTQTPTQLTVYCVFQIH